ncbi:MAG: pilus (MSHA type) biogenesis protein MshL [Campylobacteraceae bacterium]
MKTVLSKQIKSRYIPLISLSLLALVFTSSDLYSQTSNKDKPCEYRTFNMKVNSGVSANEVLSQLSNICNFSLVFSDSPSKDIANQPQYGTYIQDKTLFEVFDILAGSNNLNYEYKNSVLKLSALETKSFKVDYITSIRQGTATMSASVSVMPKEDGTSNSGSSNSGSSSDSSSDKSDNEIKVKEEFDFWKTVDAEIQAVVNSGRESYVAQPPIINSRAGLVTITATKNQLDRVEEYFNTLKQRLLKQVMIDVTILSVELNDDNRMGIDWSKFQLGFFSNSIANIFGINTGSTWTSTSTQGGSSTLGNNGPATNGGTLGSSGHIDSRDIGKIVAFDAGITFSLDGVFNFLKEKGKTSVVSSPKILTLNNQQALITVGDTINYQTRETTTNAASSSNVISEDITNYSIFIGILLNLLPTVSDDNKIMLRINPSISDFKYPEDNQKQTEARTIAPDTTEKKLSTVVNVRSGDTIVLGGLITNSVAYTNKGVPLLGDIPLLGYAFKYAGDITTTKELVFVITPRIIGDDTSSISMESLSDLGYKELVK